MGSQLLSLQGEDVWFFSPDGTLLVTVNDPDRSDSAVESGHKKVKLWDTTSGKDALMLTVESFAAPDFKLTHSPLFQERTVSFSPDGTRFAAMIEGISPDERFMSSKVKVWDITTGGELLSFSPEFSGTISQSGIEVFSFSPDGKRMVIVR